MTVTREQWDSVAADIGWTIDELVANIDRIDREYERALTEHPELPVLRQAYYDREGGMLSVGQWTVLEASRNYKHVLWTPVAAGLWVVTVWIGGGDIETLPLFLTNVYAHLPGANWHTGNPFDPVPTMSEADARREHKAVVDKWSNVRATWPDRRAR